MKEVKEMQTDIKPFLRWAGGKRWLIRHIESIKTMKINNYFEPFLGGGSIFFNIDNFENAYLSDLNSELIETYNCLKNDVEKVITKLKTYSNDEELYYKIRKLRYDDEYDRAAKFIFLNRTSYNGVYRVNRQGEFNVPFGFRRKDMDLVDPENLRKVSQKLQNVNIVCQDFCQIENNINKGDFIFLDPPYTVAHENNGFIQYNQKIFSLEDQVRLSQLVEIIKEKEAFYILTNAKHDAILEIYKNIDDPIVLTRSSTIGGSGARREGFNEYIFSNCLD
jgi:DNA adenine methylase